MDKFPPKMRLQIYSTIILEGFHTCSWHWNSYQDHSYSPGKSKSQKVAWASRGEAEAVLEPRSFFLTPTQNLYPLCHPFSPYKTDIKQIFSCFCFFLISFRWKCSIPWHQYCFPESSACSQSFSFPWYSYNVIFMTIQCLDRKAAFFWNLGDIFKRQKYIKVPQVTF